MAKRKIKLNLYQKNIYQDRYGRYWLREYINVPNGEVISQFYHVETPYGKIEKSRGKISETFKIGKAGMRPQTDFEIIERRKYEE